MRDNSDPLLVTVLLVAIIIVALKIWMRHLHNKKVERFEASLARTRAEIMSTPFGQDRYK
jgi:hypothetical protein